MNGVPLHPMIVHFPMVITILLPLFAIGALIAIRRGARPARVWMLPVAFAAVLALSSWLAVQTGEAEEDRVEEVVSGRALDAHEEAGERFLVVSGLLFLLTALGLARGAAGSIARGVGTAGSLIVLLAAIQVGRAGGELVYVHGAAAAYQQGSVAQDQGARSLDRDGGHSNDD